MRCEAKVKKFRGSTSFHTYKLVLFTSCPGLLCFHFVTIFLASSYKYWVLKQYFLLLSTYVEMYPILLWCCNAILFCLCFSTRFVFSADHDGQRLWPIPSPAAQWRPNRVRRYHPHTMGNEACTRLCVILSGARAVSHTPPPTRHICPFFSRWECFMQDHEHAF